MWDRKGIDNYFDNWWIFSVILKLVVAIVGCIVGYSSLNIVGWTTQDSWKLYHHYLPGTLKNKNQIIFEKPRWSFNNTHQVLKVICKIFTDHLEEKYSVCCEVEFSHTPQVATAFPDKTKIEARNDVMSRLRLYDMKLNLKLYHRLHLSVIMLDILHVNEQCLQKDSGLHTHTVALHERKCKMVTQLPLSWFWSIKAAVWF